MHKIEIARNAAKILESIFTSNPKLYSRLIAAIESLAKDPFQGKKLKGQFKGDYAIRAGSYRIIYTVYKEKLIVYVLDVGRQGSIYQ